MGGWEAKGEIDGEWNRWGGREGAVTREGGVLA